MFTLFLNVIIITISQFVDRPHLVPKLISKRKCYVRVKMALHIILDLYNALVLLLHLGTVTTLCPMYDMYITEKSLCESQIQLCIVRSRVLGQPATHPCRKFKEFPPRVYSLTFPHISASFVTWWCFYLRRGGETGKQRTPLESVPQVAAGCSNKTPFHNPRLQGCLWTLWLQFFAFILDLL